MEQISKQLTLGMWRLPTIATCAIAIVGIAFGADSGNAQNRAYGVWEVDAADAAEMTGGRSVRLFIEFGDKTATTTEIMLETGEVTTETRDIWWIYRDGSLYFTEDRKMTFLSSSWMTTPCGRK